jgi:hypothetical protein
MPKLFLLLMVAVIGLLPLSVSAQQKQAPVQQEVEGIDPSRLVVIGAGVLLGAVAMEILVAGDLAILAGAAAGGFVTDWWYRTREYKTLVPKAAYRAAALPVSTDIRLAMLPRQ